MRKNVAPQRPLDLLARKEWDNRFQRVSASEEMEEEEEETALSGESEAITASDESVDGGERGVRSLVSSSCQR